MVRVWRVWRRYGRRRSGEGGMDSRDPTHSSGTLAAYETMADQPRRGGPHDPPAASGRRWSPVVVGGPVGPHRWDDFTEDDLEDPLSGVTPQVYSDDFIIDSSDHGRPQPAPYTAGPYFAGPYGAGQYGADPYSDGAYVDGFYAAEAYGDEAPEQPAWWDLPIWAPPRLVLVIGALVLTIVVWPLSHGSESDQAGAAESDVAGLVPVAEGGDVVGASAFGRAWSATVPGVLTLLGNPSRSFNGTGPLPTRPRVVDRRTQPGMGAGPASQALVAERSDGHTWAISAGADGKVGFTDADSGEQLLAPLETSRAIRGTPTLDPDGYPLLYVGGDDGELRVVALDRGSQPEVLWSLRSSTVSPSQWGTDWKGSPLVRDDTLIMGGGNSNLHVIKLNRSIDEMGKVRVAPELVAALPTWDDELDRNLGDRETGIDASVALDGQTAWVVNGGGLLTGWDLSPLDRGGQARKVLRFWAGDAVDTAVTLDETGAIYLATSGRRNNARTAELGRVMKLDPGNPENPLVWSTAGSPLGDSGVAGAPVVTAGLVVVVGNEGKLVAFDRDSGRVQWARQVQAPARATPVMVDGAMVVGSCDGLLRAWDLGLDGPEERWSLNVGGCIESPVTAWAGRPFVPQRNGGLVVVGSADAAAAAG